MQFQLCAFMMSIGDRIATAYAFFTYDVDVLSGQIEEGAGWRCTKHDAYHIRGQIFD
ncbi:hypothetical protein P308_26750 [Pseudomonas piscis]|nr:hypothetical protein P308_26750 [Pseudomonas piscis]